MTQQHSQAGVSFHTLSFLLVKLCCLWLYVGLVGEVRAFHPWFCVILVRTFESRLQEWSFFSVPIYFLEQGSIWQGQICCHSLTSRSLCFIWVQSLRPNILLPFNAKRLTFPLCSKSSHQCIVMKKGNLVSLPEEAAASSDTPTEQWVFTALPSSSLCFTKEKVLGK